MKKDIITWCLILLAGSFCYSQSVKPLDSIKIWDMKGNLIEKLADRNTLKFNERMTILAREKPELDTVLATGYITDERGTLHVLTKQFFRTKTNDSIKKVIKREKLK